MLKHSIALALLAGALYNVAPASAADADASLRAALKAELSKYLATRSKPEHISAASLSVNLSGSASTINVTAGTVRYGGGAAVTPANLFQIGSNTKAFTAAAILQLEAEGKLTIEQTVGKWLPQYPAWKSITIRRLLNMTSDIPTYDDEPSMLAAYAANPRKDWSPKELVAVIYPRLKPNAGWLYSNTAYILSQMIIEKASGNSYAAEIRRRFLTDPALGLTSTYYEPHLYPASINDRTVSGYFFSNDAGNVGLRPLLGKDMRLLSVSWAQGAGGIVASSEDVTRWSRALFEGPLLASKQRKELMTLVSLKTGKPIASMSPEDPKGFGLGAGEFLTPSMGTFWFYEGMTLGYRMTYAYFPKSHVVFAVGLNSQPPHKEDHVSMLMQAIYDKLKAAGKV